MIKTKSLFLGALGALVVSNAACGSSEPEEQTTPTCVGLPTDPRCVLDVSEKSFVHSTTSVTDGVSTGMVRHTPGKFCMSGKLDGSNDANWGSLLILSLTGHTPAGLVAPFNATARGIKQLRFTIDPPPASGLTLSFSAVQRADCLDIPACFTAASFFLEDGGADKVIEAPGTVTAPLTAFAQPSWGDPTLSFDPTLIAGLQLGPQVLPGVVLDYDFCVQSVEFLDADGKAISP